MRHLLANPHPRYAGKALALAACACALAVALGACAAPAEEGPSGEALVTEGTTAASLIEGTAEGQDAPSPADPAASPAAAQDAQVTRSDARIDVYNGWVAEGLAARGAEELRGAGFSVSAIKNADTPGLEQSHVAYRSPSFEAVAQEAAQQLGIGTVFLAEPGEGKGWAYDGDVAVVLGGDWAQSRGMAAS